MTEAEIKAYRKEATAAVAPLKLDPKVAKALVDIAIQLRVFYMNDLDAICTRQELLVAGLNFYVKGNEDKGKVAKAALARAARRMEHTKMARAKLEKVGKW